MSFQFSRLPVQPNHIPIASRIGGTPVTTPLATRSIRGIVTARTAGGFSARARAVMVRVTRTVRRGSPGRNAIERKLAPDARRACCVADDSPGRGHMVHE